MPACTGRRPAAPRNGGRITANYFAAARKIAQATLVQAASATHGALILLVMLMVRSVLLHVQGHEARFHADPTDRDRDESSRRAISAWVRTNPLTQVR